ncbi:hypothetical protein GTU79_25395 [Sodalis ligni]|uniref:acyl carrier protein n=1 Tax=Sodalis ligni TaxID=2697027 RepID=UPI00193F1763|nr:phosphopantetheine-binding protein [Sodalis ligni]QWA10499.1 hypothetical protein GTU79_25395 [Sodalis ligni]
MTNTPQTHCDEPIRERLHALLADKLGRQQHEILNHLHLVNELYVDSLDLVEIEIGISETFNINISEKEVLKMETVEDLYHIVRRHITEK